MHEMTVVLNIVEVVEDFAEKNNIPAVAEVHLQLGGLTGILPHFVEQCWQAATERSEHMKKSKVIMEEIPGIGRCLKCGKKYIVPLSKGVCPECGSHSWAPVTGSDVKIKDIVVME